MTLIQPGIEALSTPTLKLMRKGTSAFSNIRFLKTCSRHPIRVSWNLLIFSPGENENTYRKYLDDFPLLTHLPPPLAVYPVEYVRYSHYFEHADKYGLDLHPEPFYALTYPYDEPTLRRIAHRFTDRNTDVEQMRYWLGALGEKIREWSTRWLNQDGQVESRLALTVQVDGPSVVHDSRPGTVTEFPLTALQERLLRLLEEPRQHGDISDLLHISQPDAQREIEFLQRRHLLFEEEGKYLSLVIM